MATTTNTEKIKTGFFADLIAAIDGTEKRIEKPAFDAASPTQNQEIKFQKTEVEIKVRSPHLEKLNADSALSILPKTEKTITAESAVAETPTFTARLNTMIAAGVSFEIAADGFQSFGASERENVFLQANKTAVLCTLQQGFLRKELFRHSPELLQAFQTEVGELSATMTDGGSEIVFEAVCKICADWIAEAITKL